MTAWFADMMIATGLLMGLVLIVRKPVARIFGPRVAYALWALPAVRMILPPLPQDLAMLPAAFVASDTVSTIWPVVAGLWIAGAAAFFLWHSIGYQRFAALVRGDAEPVSDTNDIAITKSSHVAGPIAFGVLEKSVVLPNDFGDRYSEREQHFALSHELSHHSRGDLAANVAGLALLSLHWFNPVAHIAWRAFRSDQEAACDATVLCDATDHDREDYGRALVKSALGPAPLVACRISAAHGVKNRLQHIIAARDTAHLHDTGLAIVSVATMAGLALTASSLPVTVQAPERPQLAFSKPVNDQQIAVRPRADRSISFANVAEPVQMITGDTIVVQSKLAHASAPIIAPVSAQPVVAEAARASEQKMATAALLDRVPTSDEVSQVHVLANQETSPEPAKRIALTGAQCTAQGSIIATQHLVVNDGEAFRLSMRFCVANDLSLDDKKRIVISGLAAAREKLGTDQRLPDDARQGMVNAIDEQIRRLKEGEA